jgi:hypothetical protein
MLVEIRLEMDYALLDSGVEKAFPQRTSIQQLNGKLFL